MNPAGSAETDLSGESSLRTTGDRQVLFVDDCDEIRAVVGRRLQRMGYGCVAASSVREALDRMYEPGIELALLDHELPGEDIGVLVRALGVARPRVRLVGQSGSAHAKESFARLGVLQFLRKPWTASQLLEQLVGAEQSRARS